MTATCKIMVTGASGFLGRYFATQFAQQGYPVIACVRAVGDLPSSIRQYPLRFPDARLASLLANEKPNWLVHCAGTASVGASVTNPERDYEGNVRVTESLYQTLLEQSPATGILFLSSAAVYGEPMEHPMTEATTIQPLSPYGYHKWACEQLGEGIRNRLDAPLVNLRVFSAYGPGQRKQVLWDTFRKAMNLAGQPSSTAESSQAAALPIALQNTLQNAMNPVVLLGTGQEQRDFIHVADIFDCLSLLIRHRGNLPKTLNVASGVSKTINEVARLLLDRLGLEHLPLAFNGASGAGNPQQWVVDNQRLVSLGKQTFLSFSEGLEDYVQWLKSTMEIDDATRILAVAG